jgi:predicted ATPase/DNA-binding CsgD family transcriptional regulator
MTSTTRNSRGLPAPFSSFVGRQQEIPEIRGLLGTARLVMLTGAGGVGKTRLALEVAAASVKAFPAGVWLVDLSSVREPSAVAGVVAATLGVPDQGTRPVLEQLAVHLAKRRVLVVLDNCEHLIEACAQLAQSLLSAAAELRILATSRETLGVTGEHVFAVSPLPPAQAAELLRERTAAVRPGFQVTDANRSAVTRLCADLDGLPLAIELAASRLRTLTVQQVVERLGSRFTLLTAGSRTARPHQRTLRAAIDWSWELCAPAERLLWNRLSVFAGSFSLDAVEGVCASDGIDAPDVLDLLDRLVAQSIVEPTDATGLPRYRLLESIRQYGWERLVESGEDELVLGRHRAFFLTLAERLVQEWFGPDQAEILARLRAEHGNLLTALDYRDETGADATLALAAALLYHWVAGGFLSEGRRQLERALAAAPEPTTARARALVAAAHVAQTQFELAAAHHWLDEADELAERLDEPVIRALVRGHRGVSALYQGQLVEAISDIEQAVAAHQALDDRFGAVTWLCTLAIVQATGVHPQARETGKQALAAAEAHGERWARAHVLMTLGRHAWVLGDLEEAKTVTLSALETLRGFGDTMGVAKMVEQLAWITASTGDHERAGCLLGVARSLRRDTGTAIAAGGPQDTDYHDRCETDVVRSLGRTGYARALAESSVADGPDQAIAYALDTGVEADVSPSAPNPLTRRELQIASLVAQGMTNRRIAAELVLSPRTVDGHVENILAKLEAGSRAQIASWWTATQRPAG